MKSLFYLSNDMLNKIVEISTLIGKLEYQQERNLKLRKENRIKAIHSSLAIENNTLTIEQVTDIIDGKRVLGNPKEIIEVKNAYDAYEKILTFDPYSKKDFLLAHGLLTKNLVVSSGRFRNKDVGIYDKEGNIIHVGARPQFIDQLIEDLFEWGLKDDTPEIIKSCIFHYEIEVIHPFEDGNGRMGRLWQTVILKNWNPIFEWIPIETIIHENQKEYYLSLASADRENNANVFIDFMLDVILTTTKEYLKNKPKPAKESIKVVYGLSYTENFVYEAVRKYLISHQFITTVNASDIINKSEPTTRRYLSKFVKLGLLEEHGENKNRKYSLNK